MRFGISWCVPCTWIALAVTALPSAALRYELEGQPPFASALLLEAQTGTVLFEYNADAARSPASTVKLLVQLVVMDAVADGRYSLSDTVHISGWASRIGGSQVYLKEGEVFRLDELMEAIAVHSANDACGAVAEHIAGSGEGFVDLMNEKARQLGLEHTRCVNVHGLDDTPEGEGNLTTARDLSRISLTLLRHPRVLEWSAIRSKPFRNGGFTLAATNRLLGRFEGMDGLKTGYTDRAGFCLVATAERQGMRLMSVIMGAPSERQREVQTTRLLNWGFSHFVKSPIAMAGERVGAVPLDWGKAPEVAAVTTDTVVFVLTPEQRKRLRREVDLPSLRPAPIVAGDSIGVLRISLGDSLLARVGLVAAASVGRMSVWEKLMSYF